MALLCCAHTATKASYLQTALRSAHHHSLYLLLKLSVRLHLLLPFTLLLLMCCGLSPPHPVLLFCCGRHVRASGGMMSLIMQGQPILASGHVKTGLAGLGLLSLQAMLPLLFSEGEGVRTAVRSGSCSGFGTPCACVHDMIVVPYPVQ
jgi:hypothetical protein